MKESKLIKDFKNKDVNRLRNIISGKANDSTTIQVGHTKKEEEHKEGDIWEERGKKWTIVNGIKQTYTKLDSLRNLIIMPLWCPKCSKKMSGRYDEINYKISKMCQDCVVKHETELRRLGLYAEYAKKFQENNIRGFIEEARNGIREYLNSPDDVFFTQDGERQLISFGKNKEEIAKEWLSYIDKIEKNLNDEQNSRKS